MVSSDPLMQQTQQLDQIKRFILNANFLPIALFLVMDIVLLGFIIYLGLNTWNLYNDLEIKKSELESTKQAATLIKNNKALLEENIETYNEILNELIPNEESYFKVIAAFEKLGAKTGVNIQSYSINLDDTTEEKLSLELTVSGTRENVEQLLRDYKYVSGRLITNEEMTVTFEDGAATSFTVNLIHRPFVSSDSQVTDTITQEDVDFLEDIQSMIK